MALLPATITASWSRGSTSIVKAADLTADAGDSVHASIPDATVDQLVPFAFVRSKLVWFYMVADGVLLIQTNDGTSPQEAFTLAAGKPLLWYLGCGLPVASVFAGNVTALYATNASGAAVILQVESGETL